RELIESALIGEENHLAVGLAAGLQTDAQLIQGGVPGVHAVDIDTAVAVGSPYDESALADRREDRVPVAVLEESRAVARILEQSDCIGVVVGTTGRRQKQHQCSDGER